jgi:predicted nucleic acid-binding protein
MPTAVVDTSVLVRYLTGDDSAKAELVRVLLRDSADRALLVPDVVIAELAFVLLRVYRWPARRVAGAIRAVVNHRAIDVPGSEVWLDVAGDVEEGQGLVDAYIVRTAERALISTVLTFDEGMRGLNSVRAKKLNGNL